MTRFAVAPRFHLDGEWLGRLQVGSAEAWRAPTAEELPLLLGTDQEDPIVLFRIPDHLRSKFWTLLQEAPDFGADGFPGFDRFVNALGEFLEFKALDLPSEARCDLVISQVARRESGLWGAINLADQLTSAVFVEAPASDWSSAKLDLAPGEGFRLPGSSVVTLFPAAKIDPDVLLLIRRER